MKKLNTSAVVLKSVNYQDNHRLYTLLSADAGKVRAVARGVKKINSRRLGSLDTLNRVKLQLSQSTGGFYTISEVTVLSAYKQLKQSYDKVVDALYFTELVDLFTDEANETRHIFNLFTNALDRLDSDIKNTSFLIPAFELRLLNLLGIGLELEKCVNCNTRLVVETGQVRLSLNEGGVVCHKCNLETQTISADMLGLLRRFSSSVSANEKPVKTPGLADLSGTKAIVKEYLDLMIKNYAGRRVMHRFFRER